MAHVIEQIEAANPSRRESKIKRSWWLTLFAPDFYKTVQRDTMVGFFLTAACVGLGLARIVFTGSLQNPVHDLKMIQTVTLEQFEMSYRDVIVIDARSAASFRAGRVPGALSIPNDSFDDAFAEKRQRLEKNLNQAIIVYCSSASCPAGQDLKAKLEFYGFTNISLFKGGWKEWKGAGLPLEE